MDFIQSGVELSGRGVCVGYVALLMLLMLINDSLVQISETGWDC